MSAQKKTENLNLRMSEEDMSLIIKAAQICGKSTTAFVTEASVFSAQKELMEQRFIRVKSDVFDTIDEKLLKQGEAHDRLVELFKKEYDWSN